jgi:hypothetical protein
MNRKSLMGLVMLGALAMGQARAAGQAQSAHSHSEDSNLVQVVRDATRSFQEVANATAAGYGRFLGCVSGPQEGAMGIHYVNGGFVDDGQIDANHPEALMYELRNGRLRLLGVEYIVMAAAWHANHSEPPTLGGQVFHYNSSPNRYALPAFYELHVWAWRDNPGGTFADWNERVACGGDEGK